MAYDRYSAVLIETIFVTSSYSVFVAMDSPPSSIRTYVRARNGKHYLFILISARLNINNLMNIFGPLSFRK